MNAPLPAPTDDGAARHVPGLRLPAITLPSTQGGGTRLDELPDRSIVFIYPSIGGPGDESLLDDWTLVPGARGCTSEACAIRDQIDEFEARGFAVYGLSGQARDLETQHVAELGLSYPLLSDLDLQLAEALGLPTFSFRGELYYRRLTLITQGDVIEAALYPVFPPEQAAAQALGHLGQPSCGRRDFIEETKESSGFGIDSTSFGSGVPRPTVRQGGSTRCTATGRAGEQPSMNVILGQES